MNIDELTDQHIIDRIAADDERLAQDAPSLPAGSFAAQTPAFAATLVRRRLMDALLGRMSVADALDSAELCAAVDRHKMLHRIGNLHRYMAKSFELAEDALSGLALRPRRVLIAGMGGSAIGPTLAAEILNNMGYALPVQIHRHYPDPSLALDADTLVVTSSYSGNTEESLAWWDVAKRKGCPVLGVAKGGKLAERAKATGDAFIPIPVDAFAGDDVTQQPRESIGFSLATFLALFAKLGLAVQPQGAGRVFDLAELDFASVAEWLPQWDAQWRPDARFATNAAKRLAAHFLYSNADPAQPMANPAAARTIPLVLVDESNRALGQRIENQFGECVTMPIKVLTFFEDAHNEIEQAVTCAVAANAFGEPDAFSYAAIRSDAEMPRASQRLDRTIEEGFAKHEVACKQIEPQGQTVVQQKLYLLKLLDYARAYASILAGVEPLGVPFMDHLKRVMNQTPWPQDGYTYP